MRKNLFVALALLLSASAAQAQSGMPQNGMTMKKPAGHDAVIEIKDFDFAPMDVAIAAGTSVTWKNLDGEPHTVTSTDGLFRSGAIDQGENFTFRFDKPGVYAYLCSIHPKMRATITVR